MSVARTIEIEAALRALLKEVGRTGWQNAAPTFGEREKRARLMNICREALGEDFVRREPSR